MGNPEVGIPVWPFLVASLAVWRVTHLVHAENGPWDLLARLRRRLGRGPLGSALTCFYCLSVWVAAPFVPWVTRDLASGLVVWGALSGAAIVLERISDRPPPPALWHEEPPA